MSRTLYRRGVLLRGVGSSQEYSSRQLDCHDMASVIWTGVVEGNTFRVLDLGAAVNPRLEVEIQQQPDGMGQRGWSRFDPIPTSVFSAMLIQAGVVT